jgi:hypothetical protein
VGDRLSLATEKLKFAIVSLLKTNPMGMTKTKLRELEGDNNQIDQVVTQLESDNEIHWHPVRENVNTKLYFLGPETSECRTLDTDDKKLKLNSPDLGMKHQGLTPPSLDI